MDENYLGGQTTKNISVKTVMDKLGRQYQVINAEGKPTIYHYDDYGNIDLITTPEQNQYVYTFDNQNRLATKAIPGGGTTTYAYVDAEDSTDGRDLLLSQTNGEGVKVSMEYDIYDRVVKTYLGEIGGNRLVENIYYTKGEGHVDKIKETLNQVLWEGPATDTKDSYQYDEFGRLEAYTFQHLEGTDVTTNTINDADQLEKIVLAHNGYQGFNIDVTNSFDRYDRTKSVDHSIPGYGSVTLCGNMNYSTRGQLLTKTIGSGLFSYQYEYNSARGWLQKINDPVESNEIIPTCEFEEPEDIVPPIDFNQDAHYDEFPFSELLELRFEADLRFEANEARPCPIAPCTIAGTPCTALEVAQDLTDIRDTLRQTVSVEKEVPCADGSTEVINVISTDPIFLPTNIYRIRFCDGSEAYVLASYLGQISGDYEIVQGIRVSKSTQTFEVEVDGKDVVYSFSELLEVLIEGTTITIGDYVPCGQPDCNYDLPCSPGEIAAQQAALEELKQNMDQLDAYDLEYPVYLYVVEFCNSDVLYLLEGELDVLEATTIQIIDILTFLGPKDSSPVVPNLPVPSTPGLFHMQFSYQANGNIDEMYWQVGGRAKSEYDMSYDLLNRMTNAQYSQMLNEGEQRTPENAYGVNNIIYSEDGNIENLQRRGLIGYCDNGRPEYGQIDDLTYSYNGPPNQLTGVADGSLADKGFISGGGGTYVYDGAGNMTNEPNKGLEITYNYLNLPKTITGEGSIELVYDAAGRKLRKIVTNGDDSYTLDYISGIEYRDGEVEAIYHEEGRFFFPKAEEGEEADDPRYEFFLKDHLGNTRLVIADLDGSGGLDITDDQETNELLQENHYYPFGMNQEGPWAQPFVLDEQGEILLDADGNQVVDQVRLGKYQYNGKELNQDLGLNWLDYGARWYDPSVGRWNAVDPAAEKYFSLSTYNYVSNSPINAIDPDGERIIFVNGYLGFGSPVGGAQYWNGRNSAFVRGAQEYLGDNDLMFTDVDHNALSSARGRVKAGTRWARDNYDDLVRGLNKETDDFKFVSHSMGGAFSEGVIRYLKKKGWNVTQAIHFEAFQADGFEADTDPPGYGTPENTTIGTYVIDYQLNNDPVIWHAPTSNPGSIRGATVRIREDGQSGIQFRHREPIDSGRVWQDLSRLISEALQRDENTRIRINQGN